MVALLGGVDRVSRRSNGRKTESESPMEAKAKTPLPGERKVRSTVYLRSSTVASLDAIADEHPGVTSRNGAIEYVVALHQSLKAAREARGLTGPVPLHDPGEPI